MSQTKQIGQTLDHIAKDLKLFYVNQLDPSRHTRDDPFHGTSDILDIAFFLRSKFPRHFFQRSLCSDRQ